MSSTMADKTELLIEIVKQFPVLYDTEHKDYRHFRVKNKKWNTIAAMIQEKDGKKVKNRWKNLKDSYGKYLRCKKIPSFPRGHHLERYRMWPWKRQMSFLRPFIEAALHSNTKNGKQNTDAEPSTSLEQYTSYQNQNSSDEDENPFQSSTHSAMTEAISNYYNASSSREEYDETDLIFLGYSRTVKKMSLRRQAAVKFNIAKIMMEAELEDFEDNSVYETIFNRPPSAPVDSPPDVKYCPENQE